MKMISVLAGTSGFCPFENKEEEEALNPEHCKLDYPPRKEKTQA
jgi:hypothetical protein